MTIQEIVRSIRHNSEIFLVVQRQVIEVIYSDLAMVGFRICMVVRRKGWQDDDGTWRYSFGMPQRVFQTFDPRYFKSGFTTLEDVLQAGITRMAVHIWDWIVHDEEGRRD